MCVGFFRWELAVFILANNRRVNFRLWTIRASWIESWSFIQWNGDGGNFLGLWPAIKKITNTPTSAISYVIRERFGAELESPACLTMFLRLLLVHICKRVHIQLLFLQNLQLGKWFLLANWWLHSPHNLDDVWTSSEISFYLIITVTRSRGRNRTLDWLRKFLFHTKPALF